MDLSRRLKNLSRRIDVLKRRVGHHVALTLFIGTKDDAREYAAKIGRAHAIGRDVLLVTQGEGVFKILPDGDMIKEV